MLMGDLLIIPQYELPLKIIVFNNHRLGMVQMEMEVAGLPPLWVRVEEPQLRHRRAGHRPDGSAGGGPAKSALALEKALAFNGPALVDVVTDPNVLAMPPKATVQQAKGFALAMTKMAFTGEFSDVLDTVMA